MKQIVLIVALVVAALVIAVLGGAFYVVNETQQVIITQFGKPKGAPVTSPGLRVKVPFIQNIRVGHFKQPFSLEALTSSKYITFLERATPAAFSPGRETGLMVFGNAFEGNRMYWAASVYRDVDDYGDSTPKEDGKYNFAMRLAGTPWYEDDGLKLVHVGLGFIYSNPNGDVIRFRQRPDREIHAGAHVR